MAHIAKPTIILSLLLLFAGIAVAASQPVSAEGSLLFGQKQAYTAVVRADKKVVVYAKIYLNNSGETELKNTSFTIPAGVSISNLSIYQITLPARCDKELTEKVPYQTPNDTYYNGYALNCESLEQQTFSFDEYGYGYYDSSNSDSQLVYKTVDSKKSGDTYNLNLPNSIKPQKRGAYLVSYIAADGYVSGSLGLYNLQFKTLKVPQSVEEVRVAVDVASDLYTREKPSEIKSGAESLAMSADSAKSSGASIQNKSLDKLQGSIGSGGTFTKTGKSLTPNEEFVVNGEFADQAWKLNLGWIVGGIIGFIVLLGATILLLKKAGQEEVTYNEKRQKNGKK
jgi:hypothetical protein